MRFCILWVMLTLMLLPNASYSARRDVIYSWPPQARPPLHASIATLEFDGMTFEQLVLAGSDIELIMPPLNNWQVVDPTTRDSIKFEYANIKSLTLSFSLFKENTFLPDLGDESISGYVSGLRSENANKINILNEGNYNPYKSFSIAGSNYKLVEYELKNQEKETLLARDYLIEPENHLMIIHIQGPPNAVRRVLPMLDASLQECLIEK